MDVGGILFGIVIDQVLVLVLEILLKGSVWPDDLPEKFNLQRKIQQVMLQAELAECVHRKLDIIVHYQLRLIARPGGLEPVGKLCMREADNGRLVEVVQELTKKAVSRQGNRREMPPVNQGINNLCHVILRCFQGQEARWFKRMPENLSVRN